MLSELRDMRPRVVLKAEPANPNDPLAVMARAMGNKIGYVCKDQRDHISRRKVLPEWDQDRVQNSHIKKLISWYNILIKAGITDFKDPEPEAAPAEEEKEEKKKK